MGSRHMEWDTYIPKIILKTLYVKMVPQSHFNISREEEYAISRQIQSQNPLYFSNDDSII